MRPQTARLTRIRQPSWTRKAPRWPRPAQCRVWSFAGTRLALGGRWRARSGAGSGFMPSAPAHARYAPAGNAPVRNVPVRCPRIQGAHLRLARIERRTEEDTLELPSLLPITYAAF